MKRKFLLFSLSLLFTSGLFAQVRVLDIAAMDQLINDSKNENKLQVSNKNSQAIVTANEAANTTLLEKLKNSYRTLQHRYNVLGSAINAVQIGLQATPMVQNIIEDQYSIIELARGQPILVFIAYRTELEFVEEAKSMLGYMLGLTLSLGDINQMKQSDRQLLFNYLLQELNTVENLSRLTLNAMRYSLAKGLFSSLNPFQSYITKDKDMANQIISNFKALR